jgi:hypothetical protein
MVMKLGNQRGSKKMPFEKRRNLLKEDLMKMCTVFQKNRLTIKEWARLENKLMALVSDSELDEFETMLLQKM